MSSDKYDELWSQLRQQADDGDGVKQKKKKIKIERGIKSELKTEEYPEANVSKDKKSRKRTKDNTDEETLEKKVKKRERKSSVGLNEELMEVDVVEDLELSTMSADVRSVRNDCC